MKTASAQKHSVAYDGAKNTEPSVESIINDVLLGETVKFELLMRRYNNRLFRIARGLCNDDDEAMDIVQDSWVVIFYALPKFKGPSGFGNWVSRITYNNGLMRLRKSKRVSYMSEVDENAVNGSPLTSEVPSPIAEMEHLQVKQLLERAIDRLPLPYRLVFILRAVQDLSTRETAESLEISEDTVKQRYLRAKRMMRSMLETNVIYYKEAAFEFAGERCDRIVANVLKRIAA